MKYVKLQMWRCYFKRTFQKVISIAGYKCLKSNRLPFPIVDVQNPSRAEFRLVGIILTARKILIDCKSSYHVLYAILVR